jgi:DNA-binding response OmpR family regulator
VKELSFFSKAERPTVLVVDDEEATRQLLTGVLEENGYVTDSCGTGLEGAKKASERFFNIAIINNFLPDINGVELLKGLKERAPRTRKIIITDNPSLQNAIDALNKGADAYLIKPLDVQGLLATMREQLKNQKEEQQILHAALMYSILFETFLYDTRDLVSSS